MRARTEPTLPFFDELGSHASAQMLDAQKRGRLGRDLASGCQHHVMRITVRSGTEADARAAADLWIRARQAAIDSIPPPVHDDEAVRNWFATHVVCATELWLADDEAGTLVGILVLQGPWLEQLYVEPSLTGRGIGSDLVRLAKRQRPDGLQLWTFASNRRAEQFCKRHGFVATTRTDGTHNEERAPDILYVWNGRGAVRRWRA